MDCIKNMDVKITILQVEVANLRPNPWNTNSVGAQNFEKLKGSIEKLGFFKPILARELDGGIFEILGGEHRWRAAMEADNSNSYYFDGPQNTENQGNPVQLIYGEEILVGSQVVSSSITIDQLM